MDSEKQQTQEMGIGLDTECLMRKLFLFLGKLLKWWLQDFILSWRLGLGVYTLMILLQIYGDKLWTRVISKHS